MALREGFHLAAATDCRHAQPVTRESFYSLNPAERLSKPINFNSLSASAGFDPTTFSMAVHCLITVTTRPARQAPPQASYIYHIWGRGDIGDSTPLSPHLYWGVAIAPVASPKSPPLMKRSVKMRRSDGKPVTKFPRFLSARSSSNRFTYSPINTSPAI